MSISVYSEHLSNIGTLNIQVTLQTQSNKTTSVSVSADSRALLVSHGGSEITATLPVSLPEKPGTTIPLPDKSTLDLTFRFRLSSHSPTAKDQAVVVPWMAANLSSDSTIDCSACGITLVPSSRIKQWKDLPSNGWAEMMEFWHCHKPNEPHLDDQKSLAKGYSAASRLDVSSGVAFVNTTSILFASSDLQNIDVSQISLAIIGPKKNRVSSMTISQVYDVHGIPSALD